MVNDLPVLTVTEVTRRIKGVVEGGFPSVTIQGELANFKAHGSGHLYFTLRDESCQIAGVMWRSRAGSLRFTPEDGMKVVVTGRIAVYEVRGIYQVDALSLRPVGVGDLQLAFEKLKAKLSGEGLFEPSRKRPLPLYPRQIGVVTSETGAVFHDIMTVVKRRYPSVGVILRPTRVQGTGAAGDIAAAIAEFNSLEGIDCLIVGRGGGSLEDLWAFNEEQVARAIATSRIPVVSAVGHQTDYTIADFVADLRAPTPTAAAELALPDRRELLEVLRESVYTMRANLEGVVADRRKHVRTLLKSYAFNRPLDQVRQFQQRSDEATRMLHSATAHRWELTRARFAGARQRIASLDPRLVLKRGYAMVSRGGSLIGSRDSLSPGDQVSIEFHDGAVRSQILGKE
jgi:exodeoxyribonuclease VII large subunit